MRYKMQTWLFCMLVWASTSGCTSHHDSSIIRIGNNGTVDLGKISKGGSCTKSILFTNDHKAFVVANFKTSCPCLQCTLEPSKLGTGESGTLKLVLDMQKEPDFTGGLLITVEGVDEAGKNVLEFRVMVDVIDNKIGR